MEKQRNYRNLRSFFRLLIFIFLQTSNYLWCAPQNISDYINKLEITPAENQKFIVDNEIKYQVDIQGISPLAVEIQNPASTEFYLFKTLRRSELKGSENSGTTIELWYEFGTSGENQPEPLAVKISGRLFYIPFSKIYIEENPSNLKPKLFLQFETNQIISENTKSSVMHSTVSQKIKFTVYAQHAVNISEINYELPKDSLFTKTAEYEITKSDYKNIHITSEPIPVCDFEWTPLKKGKISLPVIKAKILSYDGNFVEITIPEAFINITGASYKKQNSTSDFSFKESFSEISETENDIPEDDTGGFIIEKIKERKKTSMKFLFISLGIILFAGIVLFILKLKSPLPYLIISILLIFIIIIFTALTKKQTAIYTGGTVKSIPEVNSGKTLQINENSEVKVLKDVGGWYCIQSGSVTGWTLKDNILWI